MLEYCPLFCKVMRSFLKHVEVTTRIVLNKCPLHHGVLALSAGVDCQCRGALRVVAN